MRSVSYRLLIGCVIAIVTIAIGTAVWVGSDRILISATADYTLTGSFQLAGMPRQARSAAKAVRKRDPNLMLWGSWQEDPGIGKLMSPPFVAPAILGLYVAGHPDQSKKQGGEFNALHLERIDTAETRQLSIKRPRQAWQEVHWLIPTAWRGQPVRLIAIDQTAQRKRGWLGVSSPLSISGWRFLSRRVLVPLGFVPLYALHLLVFLLPGLPLAIVLLRRFSLSLSYAVMLGILLSSLLSYAAFFTFLPSATLGHIVGCIILVGSLIYASYCCWKQALLKTLVTPDIIWPVLLMLMVGIVYLAAVFMLDSGEFGINLEPLQDSYLDIARYRFFTSLPSDSSLPSILTERLAEGRPVKSFMSSWLSSDRPPLQAALILLQHPLIDGIYSKSSLPHQLIGTIAQSAWIAALWALCRTMALTSKQITIIFSFTIFSGFFFINSVFVWPKLLAGAFFIFAFAVALRCRWENRRPSTGEVFLVAVVLPLGMLSHGGVIFCLPALGVILWQGQCLPTLRQTALACVLAILLITPWSLYQKFYDPPGDRLVKWHLAGVGSITEQSAVTTILKSYQQAGITKIAANKWENTKQLFPQPEDFSHKKVALPLPYGWYRVTEFQHVISALGVLNLGWLVWGRLQFKRQTQQSESSRRAVLLLRMSLVSLGFWILVIFGNSISTAIVQHSSYATMILLFVGLTTLLTQLSIWLCYGLIGFQAVVFVVNWWIATAVNTEKTIVLAPNPVMIICLIITTAGLVALLAALARQREMDFVDLDRSNISQSCES